MEVIKKIGWAGTKPQPHALQC